MPIRNIRTQESSSCGYKYLALSNEKVVQKKQNPNAPVITQNILISACNSLELK